VLQVNFGYKLWESDEDGDDMGSKKQEVEAGQGGDMSTEAAQSPLDDLDGTQWEEAFEWQQEDYGTAGDGENGSMHRGRDRFWRFPPAEESSASSTTGMTAGWTVQEVQQRGAMNGSSSQDITVLGSPVSEGGDEGEVEVEGDLEVQNGVAGDGDSQIGQEIHASKCLPSASEVAESNGNGLHEKAGQPTLVSQSASAARRQENGEILSKCVKHC
jgi:hypothetical protein